MSGPLDQSTPSDASGTSADGTVLRERIAELERECRDLGARADELGRRLRDAEAAAQAATREREVAVAEATHLRARLGEVTRTLQSIADSRAWKVVTLYRSAIKERLLPADSRRRALYNRLLGTGEVRPPAGTTRTTPLQQALGWRVVREQFLPPPTAAAAAEELTARVSVVVPTLNAGPELRVVLERLRAQRGVPALEIVAVDSGSTDETLPLCERFGVKVVPCPGGAFNHGAARNTGADAAAGEFLVFMSQDAIPVGSDAVAGFVRAMQSDPLLAAASARQIPRSDADLFSCWQLWCYREKVLAYRADTVVSVERGELAALSPADRHRAAQIDNVFACVRRSAFEKLRFLPRAIAEDLDLGIRLLGQGHRIAFMSSVAAIHSHNRPPAYHLRRSFVEWLALVELVGYPPRDWRGLGTATVAPAVAEAAGLYRRVGAAVESMSGAWAGSPAEALDRVRAALARRNDAGRIATEPSIEATLAEIGRALPGAGPATSSGDAMLAFYLSLLGSFAEFVGSRPPSPEVANEFRTALFKICAETIGHCLADFGIWAERQQRDGAGFTELAAALGRGI